MKTQDEIFQTVVSVFAELFEIDPKDITLEANLYEDLDIDSIDAVDLVIELRKITGKKIQTDDFKLVRTIQDIVDHVEKLVNG